MSVSMRFNQLYSLAHCSYFDGYFFSFHIMEWLYRYYFVFNEQREISGLFLRPAEQPLE